MPPPHPDTPRKIFRMALRRADDLRAFIVRTEDQTLLDILDRFRGLLDSRYQEEHQKFVERKLEANREASRKNRSKE